MINGLSMRATVIINLNLERKYTNPSFSSHSVSLGGRGGKGETQGEKVRPIPHDGRREQSAGSWHNAGRGEQHLAVAGLPDALD